MRASPRMLTFTIRPKYGSTPFWVSRPRVVQSRPSFNTTSRQVRALAADALGAMDEDASAQVVSTAGHTTTPQLTDLLAGAYGLIAKVRHDTPGTTTRRKSAFRMFRSSATRRASVANRPRAPSIVATLSRRISTVVAPGSGRVAAIDYTTTVEPTSTSTPVEEFSDGTGILRASGLGTLAARVAKRRTSETSGKEASARRGTTYTSPEKLRMRQRLRWDSKVRSAAKRLWRLVERQQVGMTRSEYLDFHLSTYHWLLIRDGADVADFEVDDARQCGLEDWASDVPSGFQTLSCDAFCDAIFQLTDLHVDGTNTRDYVRFIKALYCGTVRRDDAGKLRWCHRWSDVVSCTNVKEAWGACIPITKVHASPSSDKMTLRSTMQILGRSAASIVKS